MKRDIDLIRTLLLQMEEGRAEFSVEGYDDDAIRYHLVLLVEAGLVHGTLYNIDQQSVPTVAVDRLTWAGHDFLDAARSDKVWRKTLKMVAERLGSVAFELLKSTLLDQAKELLKG